MTSVAQARVGLLRPVLAAVAFAAAFALGASVAPAPPGSLDRWAAGFAGHLVPLGLFFTRAGLFPVFAVLSVLLLVFGFVRRPYLALVAVPVIALVLAWRVSDAFKDLFNRPRPDYWLVIHETSASYPSGHATLSLTFYGLLAYLAWRLRPDSAQRTLLIGLAVCWILATGWSRLAVGAHYLSDVLGGYLLGASFVLLGAMAIDRLIGRNLAVPQTKVAAKAASEVFVRDETPA